MQHEAELKTILALDKPFDQKLQDIIFFYEKISPYYEIDDYAEAVSFIFINLLKDSPVLSSAIFFLEIFSLTAPNYSRTVIDEDKYTILPAITLVKLKNKNFTIDKIIGGILQVDHRGTMGYTISLILDYLLEQDLISLKDFIELLTNIIKNEYASNQRIGRFLGNLLEFNLLKTNQVTTIINDIFNNLSLQVHAKSELLYGVISSLTSSLIEISLIKSIYKLEEFNLFLSKDNNYLQNTSIGLALLLSNYIYNNKSLSALIICFLDIKASLILADSFRYMIDHSIIGMKRLATILSEQIYYRKFSFKNIALLISPHFSNIEISQLITEIINYDKNNVDKKILIEILEGFCTTEFHQFNISDIETLIINLQKSNPYILERLGIKNIKEFIQHLTSKVMN